MTDANTQPETPDGWTRDELVAGMDTVGTYGLAAEYVGLGAGYKCDRCDHFIPLDAVDSPVCPSCGRSGLIGTVIMGRQEVTALYPEGWFDD